MKTLHVHPVGTLPHSSPFHPKHNHNPTELGPRGMRGVPPSVTNARREAATTLAPLAGGGWGGHTPHPRDVRPPPRRASLGRPGQPLTETFPAAPRDPRGGALCGAPGGGQPHRRRACHCRRGAARHRPRAAQGKTRPAEAARAHSYPPAARPSPVRRTDVSPRMNARLFFCHPASHAGLGKTLAGPPQRVAAYRP